jgi:hypothetical protein
MKLRITSALPRVAQCFIISVAISLACSASKSASSPAQLPANAAISTPSSTPLTNSSVHALTACTLKLSEAPTIKRLKLGMTVDEILAVFPGSKDDAALRSTLSPRGPLGNASFLITPSKYGSAADFKEVSSVTFATLDGRLSSFTINYTGPTWPHVDKFVEKLVEEQHLPAGDQWEPYAGMENQMKTLTCTDFSVRVFSGGEGGNLNYVLVQDLEADKKLKERRRKARESASPTPAP